MIQSHMINKRRFKKKMMDFMEEADMDNDGSVSLSELEIALQDPRIHTWLQAMELDIHEVRDVFAYNVRGQSLKAHGPVENSMIGFEDLTRGLARLRGSAQTC